jgi:hypothetical protein
MKEGPANQRQPLLPRWSYFCWKKAVTIKSYSNKKNQLYVVDDALGPNSLPNCQFAVID